MLAVWTANRSRENMTCNRQWLSVKLPGRLKDYQNSSLRTGRNSGFAFFFLAWHLMPGTGHFASYGMIKTPPTTKPAWAMAARGLKGKGGMW